MFRPMLILAQDSSGDVSQIFYGLAAALVLLVVGAIGVFLVRKYLSSEVPTAAGAGSLLGEMRRLRDTGQLSKEEFDRVKAKLVADAQKELIDVPKPVDPNRRNLKQPGLIVQDKGPPHDPAKPSE